MYLKEKSELYKRMANNFERERIRLNMTQHEMAEYLEMSDSSYKRMRTRKPTVLTVWMTGHKYLNCMYVDTQKPDHRSNDAKRY